MPGFPTPLAMNFDLESQAKLHYALSIPVDEFQLNELLQIADVDLDEFSCIIRYKERRPGGFEMRQFHNRRKRTSHLPNECMPEAKSSRLDFAGLLLNTEPLLLEEDFKLEPLDDTAQDSQDSQVDVVDRESGSQESITDLLGSLKNNMNSTMLDVLEHFKLNANFEGINYAPQNIEHPEILNEANEVRMTTFLESLDSLTSEIASPELDTIQLKIKSAIEKSQEENKMIPMSKVKMMMEATLAMMGF